MSNARQLIGLALLGCLLSVSVTVSFLAVGQKQQELTRDQLLDQKERQLLYWLKKEGDRDDLQRELANVYWQKMELSKAEKILSTLWEKRIKTWDKSDAKERLEFLKDARALASTYMDNGHFDSAIAGYITILDYDRLVFGKDSAEEARDLNNLAGCYYLKATATKSAPDKKSALLQARSFCDKSNTIWNALKTPLAEANLKTNDGLARLIYRDLDDLKQRKTAS